MQLGFQTWKDILEVLIVPVMLAVVALLWPVLQEQYRRRVFTRLIFRELRELSPYPTTAKQGFGWWDHQVKDFVHKRIFDSVPENRDFILSLPPDLVYNISQLWDAKKTQDGKQWLYYLEQLGESKYDKQQTLKPIYKKWEQLLLQYDLLATGKYNF